ncbi:MAG TPA: YihA family ribosome biogenesis GTP-binding protein [Gammaproteobacteria bacterium]|nr:YihA family ribosome biogenesis GTP-binding protein [Gammaproteobacteria bacterium]
MRAFYNQAQYTTSANKSSQLPVDMGKEVAFAGRSNVGKSSAINTLTYRRGLARTSKTPGRTQLINFFEIDSEHRLVDLPGYGFAKVPDRVKQHWQQLISSYLNDRQALKGLIVIMDSRRPFTPFDIQMLDWCEHAKMPAHILLTKTDKLSKNEARATLSQAKKDLKQQIREISVSVQLFSSLKKTGIEDAYSKLNEWMDISETKETPATGR